MTVSERIFAKLDQLSMSQKEFSEKTGILPSTISEWKKKHTNPSADKIMMICKVLGVTPEWLLSGVDIEEGYRNPINWYVIDKDSDTGVLVTSYNKMTASQRTRLLGYLEALREK